MSGPIIEIRDLVRSLWNDPLFIKLLATVAGGAGALGFVVGVDWEVAWGLVGLGCMAAMLEVTLRDKKNE